MSIKESNELQAKLVRRIAVALIENNFTTTSQVNGFLESLAETFEGDTCEH